MSMNPFAQNNTETKDKNFRDLIETKNALKESRNEGFVEKNAGLIFAVGIIAFGFLMFGAIELGLASVAGKGLALAAGSCGLIGSSGLIKKGFNYFNDANKSNDKAVKSIDEAIANVAKSIGLNAQNNANNNVMETALRTIENKTQSGSRFSPDEINRMMKIADTLTSGAPRRAIFTDPLASGYGEHRGAGRGVGVGGGGGRFEGAGTGVGGRRGAGAGVGVGGGGGRFEGAGGVRGGGGDDGYEPDDVGGGGGRFGGGGGGRGGDIGGGR